MKSKEIIEWISKWNPYCEFVTLSTIFAKMRFNKGRNNVINFGTPGTGKSRSTLELIKKLDMGNDIIVDNTTTDRGLFEVFQEYPKQDIIIDECSTLLNNKITQDMIKLCMEGKPITWTKNNKTETTDPYKGNLIINTNVKIHEAVIDRCLMNKVLMNKEMSLNFNELFINEFLNTTDFSKIVDYLKKILNDPSEPELTEEEIRIIFSFVQEHIKSLERDSGFSRRIIIRELSYFKHAKKLFGKLDEEIFEYIKPFAEAYIINAQTPGLIENILGNGPLEKPELVKRVSEESGWSKQHVRKIINKKIDEGKLYLRGKMVILENKK